DASRSLAMIELGGASRAVRVGQDVDGATLVEIQSEAIVVERRGEREWIALASATRPPAAQDSGNVPAAPRGEDGGTSATDRAHRPSPSARARPAINPAFARRSAASSRPTAPARPQSEGENARSNDELLADITRQARFAGVNDDNGKLRGVAIMN